MSSNFFRQQAQSIVFSSPALASKQSQQRRPLRNVKTNASPFQVESIVQYRQLNCALSEPELHKLNPGLQYLKSILYKDATIAGSEILRQHFRDMLAKEEAERSDLMKKREAAEREMMSKVDRESAEFDKFETMRLAAVLATYLKEQKASYLKHVGERKSKLYRDYQAVYDQKDVNWTCLNCGTINLRLLYRCEWCGESSHLQDALVGLWELERSGSSTVFTVGCYRIEHHISEEPGEEGLQFFLYEEPARRWCRTRVERPTIKSRSIIQVVVGRTCVNGKVHDDGKFLEWDDGMLWKRIYTVVPKRYLHVTPSSTKRQTTTVRETPRAVAKHLKRIDNSLSIAPILLSMHQNKSVDVQTTACLAIARAITEGTLVLNQSLNQRTLGQSCHDSIQDIVECVAAVLSTHRLNASAVYAATTVLWVLLHSANDVSNHILRCVPLMISVLFQHYTKSTIHRGIDVLQSLKTLGYEEFLSFAIAHVNEKAHSSVVSDELRCFLSKLDPRIPFNRELFQALECFPLIDWLRVEMKLFQVTIPNEQHHKVVAALQDDLKLENVTSVEARTSSIVTFRVEDGEMQPILTALQKMGVGVQFGFCDVMSLTPGTSISKRKAKVNGKGKSRPRRALLQRSTEVGTAIPVAEIYAHIEASTVLSRDSIGMLFISSSIAGIGLAVDSSTCVVASMLLSPLMGPILGCSFGFAIRDRNMFLNGLLNELFALVITLLLGVLIGISLAPYAAELKWPTYEMRSRGQVVGLIYGAVVAALSGAGVALAESNANISSVVGTAIAAALLPPTVNCGICLSYAIIGPLFIKDYEDTNKSAFFEIAVGSWLLVWINIIFIYLSAVCVFKIKQVDKFQLIRKVDEGTWTNLPKLGKTPRPRASSTLIMNDEEDDDISTTLSIPIPDSSSESVLSPTTATKRRTRDSDESNVPLSQNDSI